MVYALFEEVHERVKLNVDTLFSGVAEQVFWKHLFAGRADELLHDNKYKLAKLQDITQGLIHHMIKSSTFTVPVSRLMK